LEAIERSRIRERGRVMNGREFFEERARGRILGESRERVDVDKKDGVRMESLERNPYRPRI
jgi:hypothetical protein